METNKVIESAISALIISSPTLYTRLTITPDSVVLTPVSDTIKQMVDELTKPAVMAHTLSNNKLSILFIEVAPKAIITGLVIDNTFSGDIIKTIHWISLPANISVLSPELVKDKVLVALNNMIPNGGVYNVEIKNVTELYMADTKSIGL